jgi:hypothetical protein
VLMYGIFRLLLFTSSAGARFMLTPISLSFRSEYTRRPVCQVGIVHHVPIGILPGNCVHPFH